VARIRREADELKARVGRIEPELAATQTRGDANAGKIDGLAAAAASRGKLATRHPDDPDRDLNPRALLIEDGRWAARQLSKLLIAHGYTVDDVPTVADALERLDAECPDWTLLDLLLPDGSGVDVLRAIRAKCIMTRVAILTALDEGDPIVAEARAMLGPDDTFVVKAGDYTAGLFEAMARPRTGSDPDAA
jgi:CheY-like chemotaxis protein